MPPFYFFIIVRMGELIFEVMPETVLQLFVIYHTKDISWTSTISILSSVVSAAFIMTDNSMMFERRLMVSVRGEKAIPD
jgi:branched-subunit amino acid transport protein AzlD